MNILEALADRKLLGSAFKDASTWRPWLAFLAALFGLPMSEAAEDLFRQCTGRSVLPAGQFNEAWLVCGRRAGKSFVLALIAVFLAVFRDYGSHLGPGERATIMVIAADRKQARTIMRYVKGLLEIETLSSLVESLAAESVDLSNRVTIEVGTASYKSLRGYTIAAALADEIAFWPAEDSAAPDTEILDALRPAMVTIPGAMLLCASSPYARRGALWSHFKRYYGADDTNVLVWKAPTRTMNATVPQRVIDEARERDPAAAASEYDAEFRTDIGAFVDRETIEACVATGVTVRAPLSGVRYRAFVDPSGGSSDSMTMAIAHSENERVVVDCLLERRAPFSPEAVVAEICGTLKGYRCATVTGDRYAGEWPRERFSVHGVKYEPAEMNRSELYLAFLPLLNSGRLDLLDHPRMVAQFVGLERRTARSGKDSIDHAPGSHDDIANAVAGVVEILSLRRSYTLNVSSELIAAMSRPLTSARTNSYWLPPART
jgi:Terminase large subunit, T4likevirus-type, N-terminal